MTNRSDRLDELRTLLEALCEERSTPEQVARLEELVLADPEAEAFYITYMHLHADLIRLSGGVAPGLGEESAGQEVRGGASRTEAATTGSWSSGRPARRWSWLPWAIAAAACLVAALAVWWRPDAPPPQSPSPPVAGPARGAPAAGGEPLAVVVQLDKARWDPAGGPSPDQGSTLAARRLALRSGCATLAFLSGVTLTVEGPADLDLISIDRVFCRRGKVRAHVPKGAEGFVVASVTSAVVDQGTEFALNVEDDGRMRVMVFEGQADAALLNAAGDPRHTRFMVQGEAVALDPGAGRIAQDHAAPADFVSAPSPTIPSLALDPSYAGAVLQSRPRSYWRFESLAGGAFPNEVPDGPPLRIHGPVVIEGQGNRCAAFRPLAPEQFLDSEGLWELPVEPGFAVELWFLAQGFSYGSLVALFPPQAFNPPDQADRFLHTFLLETIAWRAHPLHKAPAIRFLHRWPLDIKVHDNLFSERVYVPRRWHHVVAQINGGRMELFVDGVVQHAKPLESHHPTLPCHLVVGRRTPDAQNLRDSRSFVGRLDELALYDHPLTAQEVRSHFRRATQEGLSRLSRMHETAPAVRWPVPSPCGLTHALTRALLAERSHAVADVSLP